jgi:phosphate/sulfate permease
LPENCFNFMIISPIFGFGIGYFLFKSSICKSVALKKHVEGHPFHNISVSTNLTMNLNPKYIYAWFFPHYSLTLRILLRSGQFCTTVPLKSIPNVSLRRLGRYEKRTSEEKSREKKQGQEPRQD